MTRPSRELLNDPTWPRKKTKQKLAIATERSDIEGQLADTTSKLDTGRQFFTMRTADKR